MSKGIGLRLLDLLLRSVSPIRVPMSLYESELPAGVEVRVNRWLLELIERALGVQAVAGCAARTILLHPRTLCAPYGTVDRVLRHELVHVDQFLRWGVLGTYRRYLREWRRSGYYENALEREARGIDP